MVGGGERRTGSPAYVAMGLPAREVDCDVAGSLHVSLDTVAARGVAGGDGGGEQKWRRSRR